LFLFGGFPKNVTEKMALVYTFDTQSNSWSVPKTIGVGVDKYVLTGIVDYNGKMYLFGGYNDESLNDMLILDTINLN